MQFFSFFARGFYKMRYITADYIFPISSAPIPNGIVIINNEGIVEDVINPDKQHSISEIPKEKLETFRGIICPGFINSHCHLELSYLKGKLSEGKGLPHFIKEIISKHDVSPEVIQQAIINAEDEMIANGIVGIGDICNTNLTFTQKAKGRLRYHNFIELFDLDASRAQQVFEKGKQLAKESTNDQSQTSLAPHAPYTVSVKLLKLIKEYAVANESILTIHNQETASENEMFVSGSGKLLDLLKSLNDIYNSRQATGFRSVASALVHLPVCNKVLLVHNTYSDAEDITWAHLYSRFVWWCFCPNANLFIEKRLPDFQLFIDGSCKIVIGTDSYASNWSLSVLDELKTIHLHAPQIPLATLMQWGTLNGAVFFGWDKELGSFEKGKKPGLNLIEHADLYAMQLTAQSTVKKIA
jgi:cytosine/adenosine deaminase-related metal-dependent hydrolase